MIHTHSNTPPIPHTHPHRICSPSPPKLYNFTVNMDEPPRGVRWKPIILIGLIIHFLRPPPYLIQQKTKEEIMQVWPVIFPCKPSLPVSSILLLCGAAVQEHPIVRDCTVRYSQVSYMIHTHSNPSPLPYHTSVSLPIPPNCFSRYEMFRPNHPHQSPPSFSSVVQLLRSTPL